MSILTIVWSMAAAVCITLVQFSLSIWLRERKNKYFLFFSLAALGAAGSAFFELMQMLTTSVDSFNLLIKYGHIPTFLLLISLIWFVEFYFSKSRRWLAIIITTLWVVALIANFFSANSLVFANNLHLKQVSLPWGESFSIPVGTTNPWKYLAETASILIVIYVLDASVRSWRTGEKRPALIIGGSIVFFMLTAGIHTPLVDEGIIQSPYLISIFFLGIILAMGYELKEDIIRTSFLSQEVKRNEQRWRTMLENVELLVVGLDMKGHINYVNPFFLKLTGYHKEQVLDKNWFETFLAEKDRSEIQNVFKEVIEQDKYPHYQNELVMHGGERRTIAWSNVVLRDKDGNGTGVLSIGADETDRLNAFQEVEQLKNRLREENIYLQEEIRLDRNYRDIIGRSDVLKYALTRVKQVAATDMIVLIEGETGVGKELFARAVHHASNRNEKTLVKVNCAAIPANLIESELFGHDKGAFTGAHKMRIGRFELADGGSLFLDEIGELPMELQPKLLHVLEAGEFQRIGSNTTIKVDVRVITATNRMLKEEVSGGRFREDLYYRLSGYPITIPPLRQRREDIPLLVEHFVDSFTRKLGKRIDKIPKSSIEMLINYSWPGNVRELRNVLERAVVISYSEKLDLGDILTPTVEKLVSKPSDGETNVDKSLENVERQHIINILEECNWRINGERGAAKILDMHPNTLRNRMIKLGIKKSP